MTSKVINKKATRYFIQSAVAVLIMAAVVVADLFTKSFVEERSAGWPGKQLTVIDGFFYIRYTTNTGAAWSIGGGNEVFIKVVIVLTFVVLATLLLLLFWYSNKRHNLFIVSVALMFSGALGNLIDRLMLGKVRDFLSFILFGSYYFPIFNVADMSLVIGVILLCVWVLFFWQFGSKKKPKQAVKSETDSGSAAE